LEFAPSPLEPALVPLVLIWLNKELLLFVAIFNELLFLKSRLSLPDRPDGIEFVRLVNTSFISLPNPPLVFDENPTLFDFSNFNSEPKLNSSTTFSFVVCDSSIDISLLILLGLLLIAFDLSLWIVSS
jgi:hypothetical protein